MNTKLIIVVVLILVIFLLYKNVESKQEKFSVEKEIRYIDIHYKSLTDETDKGQFFMKVIPNLEINDSNGNNILNRNFFDAINNMNEELYNKKQNVVKNYINYINNPSYKIDLNNYIFKIDLGKVYYIKEFIDLKNPYFKIDKKIFYGNDKLGRKMRISVLKSEPIEVTSPPSSMPGPSPSPPPSSPPPSSPPLSSPPPSSPPPSSMPGPSPPPSGPSPPPSSPPPSSMPGPSPPPSGPSPPPSSMPGPSQPSGPSQPIENNNVVY